VRACYHAYGILLEAAHRAVRSIQLDTPLIDLQPGEVVRLGRHLGVPMERTWSCSRPGSACGACRSCVVRRMAFHDAAMSDPLLEPAPSPA
jgi:7-cyano-7-deazaguanine synthase